METMREHGLESRARVALIGTADSWLVVSEDPEEAMAEVAPHFFYQYCVYADWSDAHRDSRQRHD